MPRQKIDVVAYYYPGWHVSAWKPLDEWALLDDTRPYFESHNDGEVRFNIRMNANCPQSAG